MAELLPRLFNLCREAQSTAARAAFGLPLAPNWQVALRQEILRENVVKLCLKWPSLLSDIPAVALPRDWLAGGASVRAAVFGDTGHMPATYREFTAFLETQAGIAHWSGYWTRLKNCFAPGRGMPVRRSFRSRLPGKMSFTRQKPLKTRSPRVRRSIRSCKHVERKHEGSRVRLWSRDGGGFTMRLRLPDLGDDLQEAAAPAAGARYRPGSAEALYGVSVPDVEDGMRHRIFERITPTDHLLAQWRRTRPVCLRALPRRERRSAWRRLLLDPFSTHAYRSRSHPLPDWSLRDA